MSKRLRGMRVALLCADGFEQREAAQPRARLRKEGARVDVVSLRHGKVRGSNVGWRGGTLRVDVAIEDASARSYDALVLPGGFVSPDLLRQSERAIELLRNVDDADKPIAAIGHGAELLVTAAVVHRRTLTAAPGIADDVTNAGGTWVDSDVIRDRNWVTARGADDLAAFCDAMVELFAAHYVAAPAPSPWLRRTAAVVSAAVAGLVARRLVR